jgi:hypothetical protein
VKGLAVIGVILGALTIASSAGSAQAESVIGRQAGINAIHRYANLQKRKHPSSYYVLGYCRRQRSEWTGEVVVWCPIAWIYEDPLIDPEVGEILEISNRIFAFNSPRGCIAVYESLFVGGRCFNKIED